jgi:flagellar biosynthetic protein FliQ
MHVDDTLVELVKNAMIMGLKIAAPVLASGIVIGLVISIVQSVTQIQEQTLTLVPKIFAMTTVSVILLPWIVLRLAEFSAEMFRLF